MKTLITILLAVVAISATAQLTVNHDPANGVAPYNVTITYKVVKLAPYNLDWIAQNLGADHPATSLGTGGGWHFQFNTKRAIDGATGWITEDSDWQPANDPCQELGAGWRLPTANEWYNTDQWGNGRQAFKSKLKLNTAGIVYPGVTEPAAVGVIGMYWSSTQFTPDYGRAFMVMSGTATDYVMPKAYGLSVRCVK